MASQDEILWSLLENETYYGATLSKSPERTVRRPLLGSPEQYATDQLHVNEPPPPYSHSPLRRARFAVAPSPSSYPPPPPPPPPPPLRHSLPLKPTPLPHPVDDPLRTRFSRVLTDLELDLANGIRRARDGTQDSSDTNPPRHAWIYSWAPEPPTRLPWEAADAGAWPSDPPPPFASPASSKAAPVDAPRDGADTNSRMPGPWLPRWQPAPSRTAVEEATDRLLALEAHIMYARRATRRALRVWAFGEDWRPTDRRVRAAMLHWGKGALGRAWSGWCAEARRRSSRGQRVLNRLRSWRVDSLRDAWFAWRLDRLRDVRARLTASVEARLHDRTRDALRGWRDGVLEHDASLEATLIMMHTFRRWTLLAQTAVISRSLLREQLEAIDDELMLPERSSHPRRIYK